ncbi:S-adenosylmethionine:tRNA ribosyltransferase-isomerase, partial [Brevibacillus sp. SIMBA_040]|uniref:S-adenosylmethionine:tRNA ribosyltransferase-isomerase n=1 Tax=Brevibacillus sp. SIMBA_040 TaxID=3085781 RepID=UPI0039793C4B
VFNDTKVMKARLFGQKDTGGKLEVLIERLVNLDDLDTAALHLKDMSAPKWYGGKPPIVTRGLREKTIQALSA